MTKRKILFITGTRADYGKIKTLMAAVQNSPNFELFVFVTGMHLSKLHGNTYIGVLKDGWENVHIDFSSASHDEGMAQNLSIITGNLANYIRSIEPDLTVVHGDRIEALSGVIAASLQNIRTAHIEGGEVSGTIDESIRHAITKLAHEHFVSSDLAMERVLKLGEEESRIHVIGSPDIDVMLTNAQLISDAITEVYEDFNKEFVKKYSSKVGTGECIVQREEFVKMLQEWKARQPYEKQKEFELLDNTIHEVIAATKRGVKCRKADE